MRLSSSQPCFSLRPHLWVLLVLRPTEQMALQRLPLLCRLLAGACGLCSPLSRLLAHPEQASEPAQVQLQQPPVLLLLTLHRSPASLLLLATLLPPFPLRLPPGSWLEG